LGELILPFIRKYINKEYIVFLRVKILINNYINMTTAEIIAKARRLAHTNSTSYWDADAIIDLNNVYQDIIWDIVTYVDEDYFWDTGIVTSVLNQYEYLIADMWINPNAQKILQINKVFIKYKDTDTYYTKAIRVTPTTLTKDIQWYADNQSKVNPFYYIQDDSVFIFPKPDVSVINWIKIFAIVEPLALTTISAEADIILAIRFHDLIATWMKQYIYGQFKQINEKNDAINEYNTKKKLMIKQMRSRDQWEIAITAPILSQYK